MTFIYVADNGSDTNSGLTEATPIRTLNHATDIINGPGTGPYDVRLRRGDTFRGLPLSLRYSGTVAPYGTGPAPILNADETWDRIIIQAGAVHWTITGLKITTDWDGTGEYSPKGINIFAIQNGVTISNCEIEKVCVGVVCTTGLAKNNVVIRQCHIHDVNRIGPYTEGGGIYAAAVDQLKIIGNRIERVCLAEPSVYRHGIYISSGLDGGHCDGVEIIGNILDRCCATGAQFRSGGIFKDNIVARTATGISLGGGVVPDEGGVVCIIEDNIFIEGNDISPSLPRGWWLSMSNMHDSSIRRNIIAHCDGHFPVFMGNGVLPITDTVIAENKVYNWPLHNVWDGSEHNPIPDGITWDGNVQGEFVAPQRRYSDQEWTGVRAALRYIRAGFELLP